MFRASVGPHQPHLSRKNKQFFRRSAGPRKEAADVMARSSWCWLPPGSFRRGTPAPEKGALLLAPTDHLQDAQLDAEENLVRCILDEPAVPIPAACSQPGDKYFLELADRCSCSLGLPSASSAQQHSGPTSSLCPCHAQCTYTAELERDLQSMRLCSRQASKALTGR